MLPGTRLLVALLQLQLIWVTTFLLEAAALWTALFLSNMDWLSRRAGINPAPTYVALLQLQLIWVTTFLLEAAAL